MNLEAHLPLLYQFTNLSWMAPAVFLASIAGTVPVVLLLLQLFKRLHFYDNPHPRKEHRQPKPTMGGLAIIAGMLIGMLPTWGMFSFSFALVFCLAAIAVIGIMDDCRNLHAGYKLILQLGLAAIMATEGFRLETLHGLFLTGALPLPLQYALTIVGVAAVTNAFNLVDGVDGLAGGVALVSLLTLGSMLQLRGDTGFGLFAFALAGAVVGFLFFNVQPARIFMGDTGSLFLGFSIALLCLRLLQLPTDTSMQVGQPLLMAASLVVLPLMDMVRLFFSRLVRRRSPFLPDRNHMHHLLTRKGYNHRTTACIFTGVHALLIGMAALMQDLPLTTALLQLMIMPLLLIACLQRLPVRHRSRMRLIGQVQEKRSA